MSRIRSVIRDGHRHGKLARLRDLCVEYRVASDALTLAADHNAPDAVLSALFELCRREAAAYERRAATIREL